MIVNEYHVEDESGVLLRLFHSTVESGKRENREHHHIQFEISLFKSGSGRYTVGDRTYEFQKGDVFLFSTHEQHCITEIRSGEPMLLMNIQFEPRFIWSANNEWFDSRFLGIFFNRNESFKNRLNRQNPATATICNLMLQMENEMSEKKSEYELMTKVLLLYILVLLMRDYGYVQKDAAYCLDKHSRKQMENALAYIDANLTEEVSLESIAATASMSRSYFCTVFKKLNGITVWEYITARRVETAMRILRGGEDKTMLSVACECGFNNTANFNRAFKKVTGITPSEYRHRLEE